VISPVNLADCHRHRRDAKHHRQLSAEPLGRQDCTISPSASVPLVNRHVRVHRIPPHVRDDAYAPLIEAGWPQSNTDFPKMTSDIFFAADLETADPHDSARQMSICAHAMMGA